MPSGAAEAGPVAAACLRHVPKTCQVHRENPTNSATSVKERTATGPDESSSFMRSVACAGPAAAIGSARTPVAERSVAWSRSRFSLPSASAVPRRRAPSVRGRSHWVRALARTPSGRRQCGPFGCREWSRVNSSSVFGLEPIDTVEFAPSIGWLTDTGWSWFTNKTCSWSRRRRLWFRRGGRRRARYGVDQMSAVALFVGDMSDADRQTSRSRWCGRRRRHR